MPIEADQSYDAVVTAARTSESESGTPGIFLAFETSAGDITHTLYVTEKTRESVVRSLGNLGIQEDALASDEFWEDPGQFLVNAECSIKTAEDEYKGKTRVVVRWINQKTRRASSTSIARAKNLFRRTNGAQPQVMPEPDVFF